MSEKQGMSTIADLALKGASLLVITSALFSAAYQYQICHQGIFVQTIWTLSFVAVLGMAALSFLLVVQAVERALEGVLSMMSFKIHVGTSVFVMIITIALVFSCMIVIVDVFERSLLSTAITSDCVGSTVDGSDALSDVD